MSETPIETAFEFQRTAVERTHEAAIRSAETNQQVAEASVEALAAFRDVQRSAFGLAQTGTDAYFDALETALPQEADLSDVREAVTESAERVEEFDEETWNAIESALDDALEAQEAATDDYVEAVDDSFDAFLDTHEQVETQVTDATEVAADAVEIDVEAE